MRVRLITIILALTIAFSVWAPTPAMAKQADQGASAAAMAKGGPKGNTYLPALVRITNKTGGTLFLNILSMDGANSDYHFAVPSGTEGVYWVKTGKYQITFRTSACSGIRVRRVNIRSLIYRLGTWACAGSHRR